MAKELFEGLYSSHKIVFIERVEKNLHFYLKDKIVAIKKANQEIIVEINYSHLEDVLYELKNNPEFNVEILNSINYYSSKYDIFLLLSLSSMSNNFSILLKIKFKSYLGVSLEILKEEYKDLIYRISKFYKIADFYKNNKNLREVFNDVVIKSQILDGLDSFDIYIQSEFDIVKKSYFDLSISEVNESSLLKNIKFTELLTVISRLDYNSGIFPELCFCLALENILQIKVSKRAQLIRMLLSELFRISNHIFYLSKIAKILDLNLCYNRALIEHERVLRIIESITGGRIHPNFIRVGGIKQNLANEKILNLKSELNILLGKIDSLETIMLDNTIITAKLKNTGIVNKNVAVEFGLTGPNLRSCGIRYDIRKNRNLLLYKDISFLVPIGKYGDCLDRITSRFNEIYQSIKILSQILENIPDEPIKKILNLNTLKLPEVETLSSVECPHGVFKAFLEIKDNMVLSLVPITPSINSIFCSQYILEKNRIDDVNLIIASFDISSSEAIQGFYLW